MAAVSLDNFKEVNKDYFSLDPSRPVDPQILLGLCEKLERTRFMHGIFLQMNIHYELSMSSLASKTQRSRSMSRLSVLNDLYDRCLPEKHLNAQTELLRTHMPVIKYGGRTAAKEAFRLRTVKAVSGLAGRVVDSGSASDSRGKIHEVLVSGVLNTMEGVVSYPSYARQEASNSQVDGKRYNWDVTAFSDGRTLPEGEYRVQVKSDGGKRSIYHPDIALVNASVAFGIPPKDTDAFGRYATMIDDSVQQGIIPTSLARAQSYITHRMTEVGPVDEECCAINLRHVLQG